MENNRNFLMTEPVGKLFRRLAAPAITAQMVNLLYSMVDRIYIGHYDPTGLSLTGIGVCTPVLMAVSAFFLLLSFILYRREFAKLHRQAREEAAA